MPENVHLCMSVLLSLQRSVEISLCTPKYYDPPCFHYTVRNVSQIALYPNGSHFSTISLVLLNKLPYYLKIYLYIQIHRNDEITQYQTGRYISSNEIVWRMYLIGKKQDNLQQLS